MTAVFDVDLLFSQNCNQQCYYCTLHKKGNEVEIDVDYFKWIINQFKNHPVCFSIIGGEPALVTNLDVLIHEIKSTDKNFKIQVHSNSLIRKKHSFVVDDPDIIYKEHLLFDLNETGLHKFDDYDFFEINENNNYNIAILTNTFIDNYIEFWNELTPLINGQTKWKMVNNKSVVDDIEGRCEQYKKFHTLISKPYEMFIPSNNDRKFCSMCPPSSMIKFETKKIQHCCMYPSEAIEKDITQENIKKLLSHSLFDDFCSQKYCENCFSVLKNRVQYISQTKKTGVGINRTVK